MDIGYWIWGIYLQMFDTMDPHFLDDCSELGDQELDDRWIFVRVCVSGQDSLPHDSIPEFILHVLILFALVSYLIFFPALPPSYFLQFLIK